MRFVSQKLYYKIGEVCEIVGVEPYVLRYWETEFPGLTPPKNKAGQRTYRPRDIELLLEIRKLLYEDGFTISGARKQLASRTRVRAIGATPAPASKVEEKNLPAKKHAPASQRINEVRTELENILTLLERE
jgi:DNA-binding transcriptional MerR regulator